MVSYPESIDILMFRKEINYESTAGIVLVFVTSGPNTK